jgi:hypothetical protein
MATNIDTVDMSLWPQVLTGVALGAGDVYRLLIAILKNICNF